LVFGDRELEAFKNETLIEEIDESLSNSSSRFEAYATWLSDIWLQTVSVLNEAEPKKKSTGTKKQTAAGNLVDAGTEAVE
jgi:hypothetical protein